VEQTGADARRTQIEGILFALAAYSFWGFIVLLYRALDHVGVVEIVAQRVVWCLVFLALVLGFRKSFRRLWATLRSPRLLIYLFFTSALMAVNWSLFIWTIDQERVLEAALGYYINPLVSVALGVVLLGERLTRIQTLAIGLAAIGVIFFGASFGVLPWVPLTLALSFGLYGYFRKIIDVGPAVGLFIETMWLSLLALPYIFWLIQTGASQWNDTSWTPWLLIASGPATALPMVWFAAAARRVPLATVGMLQYLAPSLNFLIAVFVFGEAVTYAHIVTFGLIWTALAIFSGEMLLKEKRLRSGR